LANNTSEGETPTAPVSRSRSVAAGGSVSRGFRRASAWLLALTVGVCPLLAGSVHRPAVSAILAAVSVAFLLALAGERMRDGGLRGKAFSILFLLLVLLPLVQMIPIPMRLRRVIDPAGSTLLENAPDGTPAAWPLSLDPVSTSAEVATAAATLVVFLLTLHFSSRRRHRRLFLKAVALSGLLGVVNGIVHRLAGIDRLYGQFNVWGAVFPGPFINPNHSAEFYELAAFATLALALGAEAELRIGWYAAAAVNAAAALTTLSRGSFLALFAGGTVFVALRLRADRSGQLDVPGSGAGPWARTIAWSVGALACLVSVAVALGAAPVLDELAKTNLTGGTEKTIVWRDSWPIVVHHPLGIGRHAFDRVYPAYKTLSQNARFQFVENGPLQLLIDIGWPGMALFGVAGVWLFRRLPSRRDYIGGALAAGLVAVLAHNLVDFGLETMGIRLPFAAVAGVMVGRTWGRSDGVVNRSNAARLGDVVVMATVVVGLSVGLWSQARCGADQLEDRWREAQRGEERRLLAVEGGRRFPTDFYFPLLQSYDELARPARPGGASPRLAALNRSLRLCPSCAAVYEQAARALYRLDLRAQALSMFRDVVRLAPDRLSFVLAELDAHRYKPADLATLAVGDGEEIMDVARYLVPKKAEPEVTELLAEAGTKGVPEEERLFVKATLALALGRFDQARADLAEAQRRSPRDGRFEGALADVAEREGHPEEALEHARTAATLSPFVVELARHRLRLVIQLRRWSEIEDALERLKLTLRQNGQNVTEVHMIAGETQAARGNLARALSEFRTAATLDGTNPATWAAVGKTAESRGDMHGAEEAYRRVVSLRPDDGEAQEAIVRVEKARDDARLRQLLPVH